MRHFLRYIFWLSLFWLFIFFIQRNVFLFSNLNTLKQINWKEITQTNFYAFRMDLASYCYVMLFPLICYVIWFIQEKKWIKKILDVYFIVIIVISTFISIADNGLFRAWGVKITPKAITYLSYPKEVAESTQSSPLLLLFTLFFIQTALFIWIYFRWISKKLNPNNYPLAFRIVFPVLLLGILFIGARGGFQRWPINARVCYFSRQPLLNLSAVNSLWNFLDVLTTPDEMRENPYMFYNEKDMGGLINDLYAKDNNTNLVLTTERPNIVVILLESFSAEAVGALNPRQEISATPVFDSLSKEGLLFTNFYATGFRTEHGQIALLSGFPAQPRTSISRNRSKIQRLPLLIRDLGDAGYYSSYITGGDVNFSNTQFLLQFGGCKEVLGDTDFPSFKRKATWGIYDDEMFPLALQRINRQKQPFFNIIATTTNHEPFEVEVEPKFGDKDLKSKFLNTVYFTDKCMGDFFENAKGEPWYKNTLFVIIADHAHSLPNDQPSYSQKRHWIPCLFYGEVLKEEYHGKTIDVIASQSDFPKIILSQLHLNSSEYIWSKDIFNSSQKAFAFYTFDEGFGMIEPEQTIIYDYKLDDLIFLKDTALFKTDSLILQQGKALLQKEMEEYIKL